MRYPRENQRFYEAALLLSVIKSDPDQLSSVLELQRLLIRNIIKSERRIQRLKRARGRLKKQIKFGRLAKQESTQLKNLVIRLENRTFDTQHLLFLWRCFGDGIANIYQSKYSLKHLFYDGNYLIKEKAGFISGKAGFKKEYKVLCQGIRMGVPVVMSDLTNIIRHGDVCALSGADPVPIELKSSALNARGRRQVEELKVLANFYANDGAENFRGMPNVKRIELNLPEINYETEINNCIIQALDIGCSSISPEDGLTYCVFRKSYHSKDVASFFDETWKYDDRSTMMVQLTSDENWLPSYPFTLSLSPANSILFMQEEICIFILIHLDTLKNHFLRRGIHATMIMDKFSSIQICLDPNDLMKGVFRISEQRFLRGICEFQSLIWFADENSVALKSPPDFDTTTTDSPFFIFEPPDEWKNAKDFYSN